MRIVKGKSYTDSKDFSMQIFVANLDCKAIDKARERAFLVNIADDMSTERLNWYFVKVDHGYQHLISQLV